MGLDNSDVYMKELYSFIFSFNNNENYYLNIDNNSYAILCYYSYGPYFYFYIANGCKANNNSYDQTQTYYYTKEKGNVLALQFNFEVEDNDVFQLLFINISLFLF